ncbi:sulfate ABC transporter ATP-binding protein [Paenibacillus sp. N1-5-1-14]|uniref:sulfate/molybdate ABC transporter ATP-binding protein n=1 Tax=Paenibacillus radicibacter TaxID=2972488 RepID=UPI002159AEC8|nr:sulfate ABC transporter ATP-binding protein [Paenibacillus radicibacter]MCR8641341.1 sulfate ABC transporter ATP-binding protein [Paenibacillus radicibacter]
MQIEVRSLRKSFGGFQAARDVSFEIEKGQLIGFLGPSGGGKTTMLRMLAGLERPDAGDIYFEGQRVNDLTPQQRQIGFVFQNYALFKHMNVFENIAFGLRVKKSTKEQIKARVHELLELTGLSGLDKRLPHQLSGGQKQRVAFARALAPQPSVLLLDEPFAAIDAKVRKELRSWLKETIERVGITTIFVTHDQEEAIEVADEIMIINHGEIVQKGSPYEIYKNPMTPFVASFIGDSTVLGDISYLRGFESVEGDAIIRPEFVEIGSEEEISCLHAAERGIVRNVCFRGTSWQIELEVRDHTLVAYRSLEKMKLELGSEVYVLIHRVYVFNEVKSGSVENTCKHAKVTPPTLIRSVR